MGETQEQQSLNTGPFASKMRVAPPTEDWKVPAATQCELSGADFQKLNPPKKKRPMAQPNNLKDFGFQLSFSLLLREKYCIMPGYPGSQIAPLLKDSLFGYSTVAVDLRKHLVTWNPGFLEAGSALYDVFTHHQLILK